MMSGRSLRFRVTALGMVTVAIVLGLGAWVTVRGLASALRSDLDEQNEAIIDEVEARIAAGEDPTLIQLPLGAGGITDFSIFDDDGVLLNTSLFAVEGQVVAVEEGDVVLGEDPEFVVDVAETVDDGDFFETTRLVPLPGGGQVEIVAFTPVEIVDGSIENLITASFIIVPLLVLAAGAILWFAINSALRPVKEMTAEASRIAPSTSGERLPVPDSGDEIAALSTTLNGMLDRLDAGLTRQRQFVSDASHELRSPLTMVTGATELLKSDELPPSAAAPLSMLDRGTVRLGEVLDDLTQLAESGGVATRAEADVDDLVRREVGLVAAIADQAEVIVEMAGDVAGVAMLDETQVARAIHNLLANAIRHADTRVKVSTVVEDGGLRIVVDDDGEGVAPDDRARIFERFTRLDAGRDRSEGGSGLGLALVAAIAAAHDGKAMCTDSPLGGARFVLELPSGR